MKSRAEASDACSIHMVKLFQDERRQPGEIAEAEVVEVETFLCSERGIEVKLWMLELGTADGSNCGGQVCVVSAHWPGLRFCSFNATTGRLILQLGTKALMANWSLESWIMIAPCEAQHRSVTSASFSWILAPAHASCCVEVELIAKSNIIVVA